jgi:hypothetical protein
MARPVLARDEHIVRRAGLTSSNYDVTPDGQRFLMIRDEDDLSTARVEIGTPWPQPNRLDPAARQDVGNHTGVQRIPVVNQIARRSQEPLNGDP